jgi:hypothetical protein
VLQTEERRAQGGTYELRVSERAHACAAATADGGIRLATTAGAREAATELLRLQQQQLRQLHPFPAHLRTHSPAATTNLFLPSHHLPQSPPPVAARPKPSDYGLISRFRPQAALPLAFANARPYHHRHSCITPSPFTLISCGVHTRGGNGDSGRSSRGAATSAASAAASAARAVGHMYRSRNKGRIKRRAGKHERGLGEHEQVAGCMPSNYLLLHMFFS